MQHSIEDQIRRCREWCDANDVDIHENMIFVDRGVTGKKAGRPGLQAMFAALDTESIDVVVAFSTSRLHRKIHLALKFVEERVVEKKLRCVFVNQGIDTEKKDYWKALLIVNAVVDEFQTTNTRSHIRAGQEGLLLKKRVHNTLAWGYTGTPIPGEFTRANKPSREIKIDEELQPWVRRIFDWFVCGKLKLTTIARRLREAEVPPPIKAPQWTRSAVRYLLTNRRYIGDWSYGRSENIWFSSLDGSRQVEREKPLKEFYADWLRMIDDTLFEQAQLRIESRKLGKGAGRWAKNARGDELIDIMHEVFWCEKHRRYLSAGGGRSSFWQCKDCKREEDPEKQHLFSHLDRPLAASLVINDLVKRLLADPRTVERIQQATTLHIEDILTTPSKDSTQIERQIASEKADVKFMFDNIGATEDERQQTRQSIAIRRERIRALQAELNEIKSRQAIPPQMPTANAIDRAINALRQILMEAAASTDAETRNRANAAVKLMVGGRISLEQVGPRRSHQGYLRGSYTPKLIAAVANAVGVNGIVETGDMEMVTIDFTEPIKLESDGQRVMELLEANPDLQLKQIGQQLGLSPSRVSLARKHWHQQQGLAVPSMTKRGKMLQKLTNPPAYISRSSDVARLYKEGKLIDDIAISLQMNRDTVRKSVEYWHQENGVPYLDGRHRRKSLEQKCLKVRKSSRDHASPPSQTDMIEQPFQT